ncbi:MAG: SAM-dependent methyltransferase [Gemmatimonas sp.]|nr:SAM-dependent methyltransferase [Gemmatimonas sp.]
MTTLSLFDDAAGGGRPVPTAADRADRFYPTPLYLAEEIIARYFSDLDRDDLVLEPCAGDGRLLQAIPAHVPAVGIELDSRRAQLARERTGRRVLTGDALTVPLDFVPTCVVSNPPFELRWFEAFLARMFPIMPMDARVGMLIPCSLLQTSRTVVRLARQWSLRQDMIPRDIFPGLSVPLAFALLSKSKQRTLVGFAFYHTVAAVRDLPKATQALLDRNDGGPVWASAVTATLRALGGEASLHRIYDALEGCRPTRTRFWREKVRQTLRAYHQRVGKGVYRLAA